MTSRDFCYWLQGFFELTAAGKHPEDGSLTNVQGDMIRRHLALVFKHEIDPNAGPPAHQAELNKIHEGGTKPSPHQNYIGPQVYTPSHEGGGGPVFRC